MLAKFPDPDQVRSTGPFRNALLSRTEKAQHWNIASSSSRKRIVRNCLKREKTKRRFSLAPPTPPHGGMVPRRATRRAKLIDAA